jgi:diketogulonate reductase-like aldo/keto reductase
MEGLPREYALSDGTKIPAIGMGTASFKNKDSMVNAIMNAGYKMIDTAYIYSNEEVVGEALAECFAQGKKREDVYVVTKLWHS